MLGIRRLPIEEELENLMNEPKLSHNEKFISAVLSGTGDTLAQLLSRSKEENKALQLEITELRCKLHDSQADLKVLRSEKVKSHDLKRSQINNSTNSRLAQQEREGIIQQMEALSSRCRALENDVRDLLEEREELVNERDNTKRKLHRLNFILNKILLNQEPGKPDSRCSTHLIDLDAIITENRYFHERLKQAEEEKELSKASIAKYKTALEKCRYQGSLKLGSGENLVITHKQVGELLEQYKDEVGTSAENDMRSLCVALVDTLNQRNRAAKSQRSANKMLSERLKQLERSLEAVAGSKDYNTNNSISPNVDFMATQSLMMGYTVPTGTFPPYSENLLEDPRVCKLYKHNESKIENPITNKDSNIETRHREDNVGPKESSLHHSSFHRENSKEGEINPSVPGEDCVALFNSKDSTPNGLDSQALEEIVPTILLDTYVENVKKSKSTIVSKGAVVVEAELRDCSATECQNDESTSNRHLPTMLCAVAKEGSDSDSSFKLDMSDYDSDDNQLEIMLKEWQSECDKTVATKLKNLSPKKKRIKRKDLSIKTFLGISSKDKEIDLPEDLQEILK